MPLALQCPRCHGSVTIADDAAGQRVQCPHCEKPFLAPGIAASTNDDDDWLKLDNLPKSKSAKTDKPAPAKTTDNSFSGLPEFDAGEVVEITEADLVEADIEDEFRIPAPKAAPKKRQSDDDRLLAEFSSDLDDFTARIESPPAARAAVVPGPKPMPAAPAKAAVPVAPTHASEYRVLCNICGSNSYAKAGQAGKTIKCPDCHSPMLVPPPPKIRKKVEIDIDNAESFQFEQNSLADRRPDPFSKSAAQFLEEASREDVINTNHKYEDQPDMKEWFKNVFGVFLDPGVVMHWIALSVLAAVPTYFILSTEASILRLALIIGGAILGGVVVSCGFAILQSVANQEDSVSEWPVFDPFAWMGQLVVALAAAGVAFVPAWLACSMVFEPGLMTIAFTMFSVYTLFPFVLLSMLDMGSPFVPFSAEVARSVTKCQESWGGFYFSSGLLFVCLFLLLAMLSAMAPPVGAAIGIVAVIGIAFTYFSMIGRLAYSIGQAVNEPPMKNDIDRSSRSGSTGQE